MNKYKKIFATVALCVVTATGAVFAQDSEFDLSSQRSERQDVNPVPGQVVDHKGIVINPQPHQMAVTPNQWINVGTGVNVVDKQKSFADDIDFVKTNKKGVKLTIDYGVKQATKAAVKQVSGAYSLVVNQKGIEIVGYDERGAFYGLQTLHQLLKSKEGQLPVVRINDYPDIAYRGVVEGFYGTPWSHQVRMSLIDFYGKNKMNTYLYGPKDDPYHSCPNWRLPYPEKEAANLKELVDACRKARVEFVWAIHPGQDIKWNEEDYNNIIKKFNLMYDMGVRSFAIFFDDISGEGTRSDRQVGLLNRLTDDFVKAKGDVTSLTVCPTDYSRMWAGPGENDQLATYGKTLYPEIKVFWTGDVVCSDLTNDTMDWVNSRIKRPAYYWWNYPVTDYCRHIIMQGPVYGLSNTITEKDAVGVISNPMEHGEASKLALYSTADYTWNVAEYNPIDSWERGLRELVPEATDAYRTFAVHSCDTETGYRRDESWETKTFRLTEWTDKEAEALEKEFGKVENAPALLEASCTNKQLLKELRPWLVELGKLGTRGKKAIQLARIYRTGGDKALFWEKYVQNLMSKEDRQNYEAHKSGTMKLQPFYENMMDDMAHEFLKSLLNEMPKDYKGISSFSNSGTILTKLMLDNDTTTHYTSAMSQKAGDWIGVDLRSLREVSEISILQGRNSVDDVDFFDHAALEWSDNGKDWTTLLDDLKNQYVIHWKGETVKARYVRLRRLDSKRKNYASVRSFDVNPLRSENLDFNLKADDMDKALYMFDQNLGTSFVLGNPVSFSVPTGTKSYTVLMNEPTAPLTCKFIDAKGEIISEIALSKPYSIIELPNKNVERISIDGSAEIYEIIRNR